MNYISDCCSATAVAETLNTWNDYFLYIRNQGSDESSVVTYGTCSECKEPSKFWEAKISNEGE